MQEQRIRELFDLAVQRQASEITDNIHGFGIDNHLMGLRYAAQEAGEPLPEIFTDESFRILHHFGLSTSQVGSRMSEIVYLNFLDFFIKTKSKIYNKLQIPFFLNIK